MKIKKVLILTVIFIIGCLSFPSATRLFAADVKNTPLWTTTLGYADGKYNTPGISDARDLRHLAGFYASAGNTGHRVFCIEPGKRFRDNENVSGFAVENTKIPTGLTWNISQVKEKELKKIMSCWYNSTDINSKYPNLSKGDKDKLTAANIVSAQALVWEIVTGERIPIEATYRKPPTDTPIKVSNRILGGSYAPENAPSNSLYSNLVNAKHVATANAYKGILRCVARYTVPGWAKSTTNVKNIPLYEMKYDATQKKYKLIAKNKFNDSGYFKYFKIKINEKEIGCNNNSPAVNGVTCRYDNNNLKFTTSTVKSKVDPFRVTFEYYYKDDGKTKLFTSANMPYGYYLKNNYQTLMSGSLPLYYYINMYSTANKYQLKVNKVDENNNAIKEAGVKFNLYKGKCAGNPKKNPIKLETDANGVAMYDKLTDYGDYCIEEDTAPNGYIKGNDTDIPVSASNKAGTTSYATKNIKNTKNTLSMIKRTIKNGKAVDLDGDYCVVKTCPNKGNIENGPEFSLTSSGKKVCVVEVSNNADDGKAVYNFSQLADTCPSGTTDKIKTCKGKFDIRGVPKGEYKVVEEKASCDFELPELEQRTQIVTVDYNVNPTPVIMLNGASGIVFHKKNQNGILLDGGKYALQRKESGVYKDVLLRNTEGMEYVYSKELTEESGAYIIETIGGTANIKQLPVGDYRFVEKEAPEGYAAIKDKDSTATFTISDAQAKSDSYQNIVLVNKKTSAEGSSDSAELIVTIITGRRVINYVLIITSLATLLIILILLRRKYKK